MSARARRDATRVVVGFDARHRSAAFARQRLPTFSPAPVAGRIWWTVRCPLPVLAHAVRAGNLDAGVVVTASHNPAGDNGFKVYLGGLADPGDGRGAQLVPPADTEIASRIAHAPAAKDVPVGRGRWRLVTDGDRDDPVTAYLASVSELAHRVGKTDHARRLRIVLTAMHGVGGAVAVRAFAAAGLAEPVLVAEQADPDPDFPTVAFPNPEEPGALDLAVAQARSQDADLLVALDPDADRCCVAVPDAGADGGWRVLTGDQLGALLGSAVLDAVGGDDAGAGSAGSAVVASSIVSGDLLSAVATARGATAVRTLTGFKWLARVPGLTFAYEEALGYCCDPGAVHDKDGISAAVVAALAATRLAAQGRTLLDALDDLERAHGVHLTAPVTLRLSSPAEAAARLAALRADPPRRLGDAEVVAVEDLSEGTADLPSTDALVWRTADGDRVVVRPSGTEPKLKCYLQVVEQCGGGAGDPLAAARARASARMADLAAAVRLVVGG
ncbi:MAG: phospho-sugar mutase [Kineosporiaceae bacterium]